MTSVAVIKQGFVLGIGQFQPTMVRRPEAMILCGAGRDISNPERL